METGSNTNQARREPRPEKIEVENEARQGADVRLTPRNVARALVARTVGSNPPHSPDSGRRGVVVLHRDGGSRGHFARPQVD